MAGVDVRPFLHLLPAVRESPEQQLNATYDAEADVLYVNFRRPLKATDSELTDDDVIVRYRGKRVVGLTILHASRR